MRTLASLFLVALSIPAFSSPLDSEVVYKLPKTLFCGEHTIQTHFRISTVTKADLATRSREINPEDSGSDHHWLASINDKSFSASFWGCDDSGSIELDISQILEPADSLVVRKELKGIYTYELRDEESTTKLDCSVHY